MPKYITTKDGEKKKRVDYEDNWKATLTNNYVDTENSAHTDFQKLSNKIRPKDTIFKEKGKVPMVF